MASLCEFGNKSDELHIERSYQQEGRNNFLF